MAPPARAAQSREEISALRVDPDGGFLCVWEGSTMGRSSGQSLWKEKEWGATILAPTISPMEGDPRDGSTLGDGLFSAQEWEPFRAQSRRFMRLAQNREACLD
ncbi:hypothetical protein ZWY2020_040355 [Hordeum vulgare]|nr:hypothetical protein ZWY2020_040355 [Hordeum vulgare]